MKREHDASASQLSEADRLLIESLTSNSSHRTRLTEITLRKNISLSWKPWPEVLAQYPNLPDLLNPKLRVTNGEIELVSQNPLSAEQKHEIEKLARMLLPWKKGPFNLFGLKIDAEWQSQLKWQRLESHLPDLAGKRILDIGCNNGYYMFQCLQQNPQFVLGLDPFQRPFLQFHLLQYYLKDPRLAFQMWGWEELPLMDPGFDLIFCMGIIYHHRNPFQILKNVYKALKPGGEAVVETIVIPGEESHCLVPEDRYARMRNVWFVPTVQATMNFMKRSGFQNIRCVSDVLHLPEEQRSTPWNPSPSFSDFISSEDAGRTIEGHPAPRRAILLANR